MDLAVLRCLDTSETSIGKQLPAGVARFFIEILFFLVLKETKLFSLI